MISLDSFSPEFWRIPDEPCIPFASRGRPLSIEQALWEMDNDDWDMMVKQLFADCHSTVIPTDILLIIKETNTCSNLDSPVEVWIDKDGDFRIKVYDV